MRAVIAEDSVLLREGLARLLGENGLEVVGSCETAEDLLLKVRSYSPDVAIVDIRLPPTHNDEGMQAALEIRASHPSVGVLVLSQYVEVGLAMKLLADSADGAGYLLKDRISDVKEFIDAVQRVAEGGSAIDPIIVSTLLSRHRSDDPLAELTPREREVLELMAEGRSNQGIADKLVISLRAVEKYVSSIFGKLGLPSGAIDSRRVLAVLLYLRLNAAAGPRHQKPDPRNGQFPAFRAPVACGSVGAMAVTLRRVISGRDPAGSCGRALVPPTGRRARRLRGHPPRRRRLDLRAHRVPPVHPSDGASPCSCS